MHRAVQSDNRKFIIDSPGKMHIIMFETEGGILGDLEKGETIPSSAERR